MRLIDADALLAEYDRQHDGEPGKARQLIEDAPNVDAVEVVRCKDCVSHNICKFEQFQGLNGFCSYGERKCNATDRC